MLSDIVLTDPSRTLEGPSAATNADRVRYYDDLISAINAVSLPGSAIRLHDTRRDEQEERDT